MPKGVHNEFRPIEPGRWDDIYDTHFSQGFVAGEFVFVSGQVAADENGKLVGDDDIEQQTRQVFANIEQVLRSEGVRLEEIVQVNVFLLDIGDIPRIARVRREVFGEHRPASTAVQVSGLLLPGAKVEINAVALRNGSP
jgi:2-iminobutanoate/2-iminopropanoate deaminase